MSTLQEAKAKAPKKRKPKKDEPKIADLLIGLARENAEFFHDGGKNAFAAVGAKTYRVKSKAFKLWLMGLFYRVQGRSANSEAVTTAISTLESQSIFDSPEKPVFVRLAGCEGKIYLHLADEEDTVIEIDANGWRTCENAPVRFLVTPNAQPLPLPETGGKIEELRGFVNCPEDETFALLVGFISSCFLPDGPFPLLTLTGVQGSAKSTTSRVVKSLIDPEKVRDRCAPKNPRDLAIWAGNSRLLSMDNLSNFADWLSDACCRLATGGGLGTRTLYENEDETLFDAKRPIILNGIEDFVTRADLLDRSIIQRHPAIPDENRRLESELWTEFNEAKPRLLGAILDRVTAGLKTLPSVDKSALPRMADACAFAVACESGMGEPSRFLEAFRQNQSESHDLVLADSMIAPHLLTFLDQRGGRWEGTASELFAAMKPPGDHLPKDWPKRPSMLSGAIRRIAPALAKVHGITLETPRSPDRKRTRLIRFSRSDSDSGSDSSPEASKNGSPAASNGQVRTTADDADDTFPEFPASRDPDDWKWQMPPD